LQANKAAYDGDVPTNVLAVDHFTNENWTIFKKKEAQLVIKIRYNLLKGCRKQDGEL
jgi:hypothetical protein